MTIINDDVEVTSREAVMQDQLYRESSLPSLEMEFGLTIRRIATGAPPTTVTHVLLQEVERPPTIETIAAVIGVATYEIEGIVAALEEHGYVLQFVENGLKKYLLRG